MTISDAQRKQDSCRFCGLLAQAVARYSLEKPSHRSTLFLTWEVDGRQTQDVNRHVNRTRRIRVAWANDKSAEQESFYLVLVAPHLYQQTYTDSDAYAAFAPDRHFLGRGLVDSTKHSLIKSWIDLCVKNHGKDCYKKHGSPRDFRRLVKGTHFGVVDVVDMCLKELPFQANGEPADYVALSYVWGRPSSGQAYTTVRSNVTLHIQHGGLEKVWDQLPRTIRDAIRLVNRLGERYVWIDSLCIVQDSITSWELNAQAMHLVYGNAKFTICAADGDAETGLRATEPLPRDINLGSDGSGSPKPLGEGMRDPSNLVTAECVPGVRLLAIRSPEAVIQDSDWNKRGWTFQERLLSRRCLIFAEGHVYFQCRSSVMSQDTFTDGGINGWSLDWMNAPLKTLGELSRRAFWFYMKCIRLYTGRQLSQPQDILTAFQGTSWLLQQRMKAPLLFGLPTSHFDLAVLWSPVESVTRGEKRDHPLSEAACSQDKLGRCTCNVREVRYRDKELPSWSWCGWVGDKAEYQASMVDGCLLNVQEWLMKHTWILWYFRDGEGNLRPLWDQNSFAEDDSEEVQWRGYRGRLAQQARAVRTSESLNRGEFARAFSPDRTNTRASSISSRRPPSTHRQRPRSRSRSRTRFRTQDPSPAPARRATGSGLGWTRTPNTRFVERLTTDTYSAMPELFAPYSYYNTYATPSPYSAHAPPQLYSGYAQPGPWYPQYPPPPPPPPTEIPAPSRPDFGYGQPRPSFYWTDFLEATSSSQSDRDSNEDIESISDSDSESWASARETVSDEEDSASSDSASIIHPVRARGPARDRARGPKSKSAATDCYGRVLRHAEQTSTKFTKIISDKPFGVIQGPFPEEHRDHSRAMPILQFWTWRTALYVQPAEAPRDIPSSICEGGLTRHNILDQAGDWCGSIVLPGRWNADQRNRSYVFIALSDAKVFTTEECTSWNYYIPKARDESEWDLYYVLLLQRNRHRALWERVALGKVFRAAFHDANWEEIILG